MMPPELKILYVWTSDERSTPSAENLESTVAFVDATATTFSVVVLNGRIVKNRYGVPGERWTSPKDYIKKHNLAPCNPVIERIEMF